LVLGICNGFQVLCEARLLPGALLANANLRFTSRLLELDVVRADTAFTRACASAGGGGGGGGGGAGGRAGQWRRGAAQTADPGEARVGPLLRRRAHARGDGGRRPGRAPLRTRP